MKSGELQSAVSDGAVLTYQPTTVVSDIIIDDWNSGTSPGSPSPSEKRGIDIVGFRWPTPDVNCAAGSDYYTVRCSVYEDPAYTGSIRELPAT